MSNVSSSTTNQPKQSRASYLTLVILFALIGIVWFLRQDISDWFKLQSYTPNAEISALTKADTMTPYATKVFYVNHPRIDNKTAFSKSCNNRTEQTIVLGCYHGGQNGIYLLNVDDQRLDGVEEVTAAHEMLHAAYERLDSKERQRIDTALQDFYDTTLEDQRVRETVDSYRKTEPNDLVNEMHSIFATEVLNLPSELENYYRQYFTNRSAVVSYATDYANEFTSRRQQVSEYDARLAEQKKEIDSLTAQLAVEGQELAAKRSQLDAARSRGDTATYNQLVPSYNAAVRSYNNNIARARNLINDYNRMVEERNKIALEVQALARAISGDTLPKTD
jgi:hypothetical protein